MQLRIQREQREHNGRILFGLTCLLHLEKETRTLIERHAALQQLDEKQGAIATQLCVGKIDYSFESVWEAVAFENEVIEAVMALARYLNDATYYGLAPYNQTAFYIGSYQGEGKYAARTNVEPGAETDE